MTPEEYYCKEEDHKWLRISGAEMGNMNLADKYICTKCGEDRWGSSKKSAFSKIRLYDHLMKSK